RRRTTRARADRCFNARAGADVLRVSDGLVANRNASGRSRFVQIAFTGLVLGRELSHLGPASPGADERDDLRLGVDGRDGNGDLADGAIVPDDLAASAGDRYRHLVLEHR